MPIAPVSIMNISKKMVSKKGSAVNDLAQKAMNDLGGVTPAKAKKILPAPIESEKFVKSESKNKVSACMGDEMPFLCGYSMDSCGTAV